MRGRRRHFLARELASSALAALCVAGCGADGSTRFAGGPPDAEATFGSCAFCHRDLAVRMVETGGHHDLSLTCELCHDDLRPDDPGEGHRSVPACLDCHDQRTHHEDLTAGTPDECLSCHTAHGSPNLFLVRERVTTPDGSERDVDFTNLRGLADGGFASASRPGTGLCEICHQTTRYFRSDGSGEEHFPFTCFTCHSHRQAFSPR